MEVLKLIFLFNSVIFRFHAGNLHVSCVGIFKDFCTQQKNPTKHRLLSLSRRDGFGHVAFKVHDVNEICDELDSSGVKFQSLKAVFFLKAANFCCQRFFFWGWWIIGSLDIWMWVFFSISGRCCDIELINQIFSIIYCISKKKYSST